MKKKTSAKENIGALGLTLPETLPPLAPSPRRGVGVKTRVWDFFQAGPVFVGLERSQVPDPHRGWGDFACEFASGACDPDFVAFNSNNRRYHYPARAYTPFRAAFIQVDPWQFFGEGLFLYSGRAFSDDVPRIQKSGIPYLVELLRYARKNFVRTLRDQLLFKNGFAYADQKPTTHWDPDGWVCGPGDGLGDALVSDTPFGFDFTECCAIHDACYRQCFMSRAECDLSFHDCMHLVVMTSGAGDFAQWWGRAAADAYYWAVDQFGKPAYCAHQVACYCTQPAKIPPECL